jgi:hypothetical protein
VGGKVFVIKRYIGLSITEYYNVRTGMDRFLSWINGSRALTRDPRD